MTLSTDNPIGKVVVIGGGIGGIQSALDLAETGFYVYLVENTHTLGGTMARLDKTFPTNDCSTCMFSPKLVQVAGHPNVEILTGARLLDLDGDPGHFSLRIEQQPRFIDPDKCIACGQCAVKCPKKVPDEFNGQLSRRRAAYLTFPQAVPLKYALDAGHCLYLTRERCGLCKKICPTGAVDFDQQARVLSLNAGAIIISTGFELALTEQHGEYGYGRYPNVVSSLQYERMLSATGPYSGHLQRPSDGKAPARVAWIQCVMSRDLSRRRPFCSSVCCMHAAKQAVMTRSHLPDCQATIYFMDIRAQGKGFDDYIERARHIDGVRYKRSMISQVYWNPESDDLTIETFDHQANRKLEETYDLVVLSSGFKPTAAFGDLTRRLGMTTNAYGYLNTDFDDPVTTSRPGVFVCGGIESPKDIPETVMQASAAAAAAAALLRPARHSQTASRTATAEEPLDDVPRIGVFVCHCGSNIAGVVDIADVVRAVEQMPRVEYVTDFMFSCSNETQPEIIKQIKQHRLNRIVVAACTPKTHEPLFQDTLRQAGLNPYLFTMANIRNQCSWVHADRPRQATLKSIELVRAAVGRAAHLQPLHETTYAVVNQGLVIGGGVTGMVAALTLGDQGFDVHLVERDTRLGGFARHLTETLEGESPARLIRHLTERIIHHPAITVHLESRLAGHSGHVGDFKGTIDSPTGRQNITYGAIVVATGARAYQPDEYLYGHDQRVCTQVELARRMADDPQWAQNLRRVVMIQCVGSRTDEFPYCSRVCCAAAVKNSLTIKALNPEAQVVILYRDLRTSGFKELFYLKARRKGVLFFRTIPDDAPVVFDRDGRLTVDFTDRSSRQAFRVQPDLIVLSSGIRPAHGADNTARMLKLPRTSEGFFLEAHVKLRPLDFATPGIFLAGLAHSPRFIKESIIMAKGAAQQAVGILSRETMATSAAVAVVEPSLCASCLACVRSCPFQAPYINSEGVSEIPPSECRGCGICVCECPALAISLKHTSDAQINAKIDALLDGIRS